MNKLLAATAALLAVSTTTHASAQSNFNCQNAKTSDDVKFCRMHEVLPTRLTEQQAFARMLEIYGPIEAAHLNRPGKLVWTGEPSFPGCPAVPVPMWYFVWDGQQDKSLCGQCGPVDITVTGWLAVDTPCGPGTGPNNSK